MSHRVILNGHFEPIGMCVELSPITGNAGIPVRVQHEGAGLKDFPGTCCAWCGLEARVPS